MASETISGNQNDGWNRLTLQGLCLSALWCVSFGAILYLKWQDAQTLPLNAWGICSLVVRPSCPSVARIRLLAEYEALKAQQEELRQQVEEAKLLVMNTGRHAAGTETLLNFTRADAQPIFVSTGGSHSSSFLRSDIQNTGGPAREVRLEHNADCEIILHVKDLWKTDEINAMVIRQDPPKIKYPFTFQLHYRDSFDRPTLGCSSTIKTFILEKSAALRQEAAPQSPQTRRGLKAQPSAA
jgi:hypothetical protein